jgi:Family of unknown function (DUF5946)
MRARGQAAERLPGDRAELLESSRCPGCGVELPATGGPAHAYIGASPECWALYGEVLEPDYGNRNMPAIHRLTVDTYAAQHPGTPGRRAEQSVALHLGGLCMVLERELDPDYVHRAMAGMTERPRPFGWLEPPVSLGSVTVQDVLDASCHEERDARVRDWALDVWRAWEPHHEAIRAWLDADANGGHCHE